MEATIPCVGVSRPLKVRLARLLGPALDAGRRALEELDPDQVPAGLRRVAAHSGELTPPLADRLLRQLDELDWLRERALALWPEADPEGEGPERASALFLARPRGWAVDLLSVVAERTVELAAADLSREDRRSRSLQRDLEAAREREKTWRRRMEQADKQIQALRRSAADPARSSRAEAARLAREAARAEERWAERREDLEGRLAAAEAGAEALRGELHRAKSERADLQARLADAAGAPSWQGRDPESLARLLDEVALQARLPMPDPMWPGAEERPFELPQGVRPDEAKAVDALLHHRGPVAVVVDGYNAALSLGGGTPAEVRSRLEAVLARLAVVAAPSKRVTVVWDSSVGAAERRRVQGVEVRFADQGSSADDLVVELAAAAEVPVVVVTNDRLLRERAEAVGAAALWADALVAWSRRR